jgi:hypothetical protein
MGHPSYTIQANTSDSHQTQPGWVVLFVRFEEPASMYSSLTQSPDRINLMATREHRMSVVENDCVSVQIQSNKEDFSGSCSLGLKVTDTNWLHAVSPGDWAFVWISPQREDAARIANTLRTQPPSAFGNKLCSWDSGLKFFGRVVGVRLSDSTSESGVRAANVQVSCQSFLELATSVYYTYVGIDKPDTTQTPSGKATPESAGISAALRTKAVESRLNRALEERAKKFFQAYVGSKAVSPDSIIEFLFAIIMGIPNEAADKKGPTTPVAGVVSDAILIPPIVGQILGRPRARYLWELYSVYLGIQSFDASKPTLWEKFSPEFVKSDDGVDQVYRRAKQRCKGIQPFYVPEWSNETMWDILSQFLNPVVNEMFTTVRINSDNTISPTLMVREKPFTTGLINNHHLRESKVIDIKKLTAAGRTLADQILNRTPSDDTSSEPRYGPADESDAATSTAGATSTYTWYDNLPRWVIAPSMVRSTSLGTSETRRINFVQVWGNGGGAEFLGQKIDPASWRATQINLGNAVSDDKDIRRNGLRADIKDTSWDFAEVNGRITTQVAEWAKMRATWLFNGHLKLFGSIECNGIKEPIAVGDNLQLRNVLLHIDGISHSCGVSASGRKYFTTVARVSQGMLASSVNRKNPPSYVAHLDVGRSSASLPAPTIYQAVVGKEEG